MVIDLVGSFYEDRTRGFDHQRCVNWFPAFSESGASKSKVQLICTPGKRLAVSASPAQGDGCRGIYETSNGRVFVVFGNSLFEMSSNEDLTDRNSSVRFFRTTGFVSMSDNGTQLMITDEGASYIYTLSTDSIVQIIDADYPANVSSVNYKDGFFVVTESGSKRFYASDLNDGSSWNALSFASITSQPDTLTGCIVVNTDLKLFGKRINETWVNIDNPDFPFERVNGAVSEVGCKSPRTIQKINNRIYWLGSNKNGFGRVWRTRGYSEEPVSTSAIERVLTGAGDVEDAIAYTYQSEGHSFYVLTLPSIEKTFVYDESTSLWHERAYLDNGTLKSHRSSFQVMAFGKNYITWTGDNNIYELSNDVYSDAGSAIKRIRTSPHIHNENKRIRVNKIEFELERGQGLTTGQGSDPQLMYRDSGDGGFSWSSEQFCSMGEKGEYKARIEYYTRGTERDWIFEISVSDPVKANIIGAYINVEPWRN